MAPAAAALEKAASERIRHVWRLHAVDDDLATALGRRVLVAGRDLKNLGMELKSVEEGPLDLNHRQFQVMRHSLREGVPPFVFQFTAPPTHPWCFRIHALREDSLEILRRRPYVTLSERTAEAFTMALFMGTSFTQTTHVQANRYELTPRPNQHPGNCITCGQRLDRGEGVLWRPLDGQRWALSHPHHHKAPPEIRPAGGLAGYVDSRDAVLGNRRPAVPYGATTVEIVPNNGEPAYYLQDFSDDVVADDVWPEVVAPTSYEMPALREIHAWQAAQVLQAFGVFDQSPEPVPRRPDLTVVRNQASAQEIADRVLAKIRSDKKEPLFTNKEAVERLESRLASRFIGSPWADAASLRRMSAFADRLRHMGIPGPFSGSDSRRSYYDWLSDPEAADPATWDWAAIRTYEQRALEKSRRLPPCNVCGKPMWLDQPEHHYACG